MTPEGKVKAAVDLLLKRHGVYYLKPVQNGMGAPGLDYHGVHRGLGFAIETKAPGKHPTPRQINTAKAIHAAGGTVFLIDSVDLTELSNWLYLPIPGHLSSAWMRSCETTSRTSTTPPSDK